MRRLFFAAVIVLCLALPGWGATYYMRADGSAANKEAAIGPTSDATKCMSVATHNAETFSPGDIITISPLGGDYRATLTPPSSGTSGNTITYIRETGQDKPIFNGSAVKANGDFTSHVISPEVTLYQGTAGTDFNNAASYNIREEFPVGSVASSPTVASFTVTAQTDQDWVITGMGVGQQVADPTGDAGQDRTNNIRITFDTGNNGVTVTAGTSKESDQITLTGIDLSQPFVVTVFAESRYFQRTTTAHRMWFGGAGYGDQSQTLDTAYTLPTTTYGFLRKITGYSPVTIWKVSQATDPRIVWEDNTALTNQASANDCAAAGSWFWDTVDTLYVNATDGSDITANGMLYEAGSLTECIDTNDNDYITLDGLVAVQSIGTVANVGGIKLTGDNLIAQNCESYRHERHCLSHYRSTNSIIQDCIGQGSYTAPIVTFWDNLATDNIMRRCTLTQDLSANGIVVVHGGALRNILESCTLNGTFSGSNGHHIYVYDAGTSTFTIRYNSLTGKCNRLIYVKDADTVNINNNVVNMTSLSDNAINIEASANDSIYNNTFYWTSTKYALSGLSTSTNILFKNNICSTPRYIIMAATANTGFVSGPNVFYGGSATPFSWSGTTYSFADWKTQSSQDAASAETNPLFVTAGSDFRLQSGSPCIVSGINVGLTQDYSGWPVPSNGGYPIGAYAYRGAGFWF